MALDAVWTAERDAAERAPAQTFIFDHLPKTGGSAFKAVLEQIFGVENVSPAVSGRSELWAAQKYAEYAVITGHFHSPRPIAVANNGRARITLLRDPINRVVSEYYYYRNDVERVQWNKLAILAKDHDLYAYVKLLESNRDTAVSNLYSRRFAAQLSRQLWSSGKILELAKAALARYDFVGIQEQFVDSVDMFCCRFGLPPVHDMPRVNVTSAREKLQDLDTRTRTKLLELNRLDIELYNFAVQRFEAQKRTVFHACAGGGKPKSTLADLWAWSDARQSADPESFGDRSVEICDARIVGGTAGANALRSGDEASICLDIEAHIDVPELTVGIEISDELGEIVFGTNTYVMGECRPVVAGRRYTVEFAFAASLRHGRYFVGASLHTGATHEDRCFHWCDRLVTFDVVDEYSNVFVGYCRLQPAIRWQTPEAAPFSGSPAG